MKFFYTPSTVFCKWDGLGGSGYASNCGYLVGCGKNGKNKIKKFPLRKVGGNVMGQPPSPYLALPPMMSPQDKKIIVSAEMTGKPKEITKGQFNLWSYLVDYGKKKWDATKNYAKQKWGATKSYVMDKWGSMKNTAKEKWRKMMERLAAVKLKMREVTGKAWKGTKKKLGDWGRNAKIYAKAYTIVLIETLKEIGVSGMQLTKSMLEELSGFMKKAGWTPVMIAAAINTLRHPPPMWMPIALRFIDTVPKLINAFGAVTPVGAASSAISSVSKVVGTFAGSGMKRKPRRRYSGKARFVKGSPEAKAYMRYLRSLRRS